MNILITNGHTQLQHKLLDTLSANHQPHLFSDDLRVPTEVEPALDGIDTIIHLGPLALMEAKTTDELTALDEATRGAYVLMNAARTAGIKHIILASSLATFDRLPTHWRVNEEWRPRPTPALDQLCPWLTELSVRESTRVGQMQVACLRFGQIVDDATVAGQPYDPRWLHIDDAVQGIQQALAYQHDVQPDWTVFHITAAGPHAKIRHSNQQSGKVLGYQPAHDFAEQANASGAQAEPDRRAWRQVLAPPTPVPSRPIRNVVNFGAGGPMGAVTTQELLSSYTLRITDVRPIADIAAEANPQAPGAPLPAPLDPPHENRVVDVRDSQQVMDACEGMDAILNCSVMRPHPVNAFLVNTIGAYNVMQAAVAHNIRRVVHTGPLLHWTGIDEPISGATDYHWDYDIHVDAPGRALSHLYIHSKYLGQEICRVFAEYYDLEVPVLLFMSLVNPETAQHSHGFQISWADTGRALRRALEVTSLPSPYEMVNISADLPHGRFDHDKARVLLEWTPRDNLAHLWQDG